MAKRKRTYDEVDYWESMADNMVALLLLVLLIVMLLILYLVRIPDTDFVDLYQGDQYESFNDPEAGGGNHAYGEIDDQPGDQWNEEVNPRGAGGTTGIGGAGGTEGAGGVRGTGGHGGEFGEEEGLMDDPDPGAGEGEGTDRAAVLVQVVDAETQRTIKLKGIQFELYGSNSALQVLSTYYPKKIEYKQYETDETGVFYLPEKVLLDDYYLHQLTGLSGYNTTENVSFSVDRPYDWSDPYVVTVSLSPSRNIIRIQLRDQDDGRTVGNATFDVVADEDIVTKDGTTRFKKGDIVSTITLDEKGFGESGELFLGKYALRQAVVPEFYARIATEPKVTIEDRSDAQSSNVTQVTTRKTTMRVQLLDELYDTTPLQGAKFRFTTDSGTVVENPVTDDKGRFTVTNLRKNTTYHLVQESKVGDYLVDQSDHTFSVDSDGMINGNAEGILPLTNRLIRVSIGVCDKIFRGQVSDIHVALMDSSGKVVKNWTTSGLEQVVTGLTPGEYKVILKGDDSNAFIIRVEDQMELQSYQFDEWTTADVGAVIGMLVALGGMIVLLRMVLIQNRAQRREKGGK